MGWNVGLAVVEGSSMDEVRAQVLRPNELSEATKVVDLQDASRSPWSDDAVGFGVFGDRVLVTNTFLWERQAAWEMLARSGCVLVFFLSENWGGSNLYDLYERGALVRSYREDDGHKKPIFQGVPSRFEPASALEMHPADLIGHLFKQMTGQALFQSSTLDTKIALHRRR